MLPLLVLVCVCGRIKNVCGSCRDPSFAWSLPWRQSVPAAPEMFFNVRKKLPVLKGFRTCIDNKKSLLHLPGQSRSRGHPSVNFLCGLRALSVSSWTSQRFTTSSGPPTKALRLLFHITTSNTAPHPFLRRSSAHSLFHGAGGCSPADAYQQKNFPLCKSCRFLRAISPIFLLICALGKCCTTSA